MRHGATVTYKNTVFERPLAATTCAACAVLIYVILSMASMAVSASSITLGSGSGVSGGTSSDLSIVHRGDGQDNYGTWHWGYDARYFSVVSAVATSPYTTECLGSVQGGVPVIRVRYNSAAPLPVGPTSLCTIRLGISASTPAAAYTLSPAGPAGCCGCTGTSCSSNTAQLNVSNSGQSCPAGIPRVAPDSRYVNMGNGTVRDNKTQLIWKQCLEGREGASCAGTPTVVNWQTALQNAGNSNFAGFNDWRLPNVKELQSLVETGCINPAINVTLFPNSSLPLPNSSFQAWSSTTHTTIAEAWQVEFYTGNVRALPKDLTGAVRLVRGGL